MNARVARIRIYPIKSLDARELVESLLVGGAGLAGDREYALFDLDGAVLNAKRLGETIIRVRTSHREGVLTVSMEGEQAEFRLPDGQGQLAGWFSAKLGQPVMIARDSQKGYPDDEEASGPTIVSTATLIAVSEEFALDIEEVRRRFRTNIELEGLAPFEEDLLFGREGEPKRFRIGDVAFLGVNPCQRCAVPSRDSVDGSIAAPDFARRLGELRRKRLVPGVERSWFNHYYRLAVNTIVPAGEDGKVIRVGDSVS